MKLFKSIILGIFIYVFLYGLIFNNIPISASKIVVLILFPLVLIHISFSNTNLSLIKTSKYYSRTFLIFFYLILYSFFIDFLQGFSNYTLSYSFFLFIIDFGLGAFLLCYIGLVIMEMNVEDFRQLLSIVIMVQTVFVYCYFFLPDFAYFTNTILPNTSNVRTAEITSIGVRSRGFSNVTGASFSLIQSFGYFFFTLFSFQSKGPKKILNLFCALLIFLSLILIGRTGLVACFLFTLLFYTFIIFDGRIKDVFKHLLVSVFILTFTALVGYMLFSGIYLYKVQAILEFAFELFYNYVKKGDFSSSSSDSLLASLKLPKEISIWLLGKGDFDDRSINTDAGYLRILYCCGLFFVFLFYYFFYRLLKLYKSFILDRYEKYWIYSIFIVLFIAEIKEPFFIKPMICKILFLLIFSSLIIIPPKKEDLILSSK
jgi:hypothetical protein